MSNPAMTMRLFVPWIEVCFLIHLETTPPGEEESVIFGVTEGMVFGSSVVEEGIWALVDMMLACA